MYVCMYSKLWRGKFFKRKRKPHTLTEKRHKVKKFANYQNKIVGNSLAFYRHDLFLLKTLKFLVLDGHKSTVKTFDDRFARCENIVWILFKSMLGSSFPPPLILVLHEKPPFLYRDWKQYARAVCYPLSCFSLSSFSGPPEKPDYLENFHPGIPAPQYWDPRS